MTDNDTQPAPIEVTGQQQSSRGAHLRKYQFKKGQSGNPNGRAKGPGFYDALRAYADEKPEAGDDATRFAGVLRVLFKRAMEGSSRHTQLILDRLVPHKSIKVTEDHKSVTVLMQIAAPPAQWVQPMVTVDGEGHARLVDSKSSEDAEDE